MGKLKELGGVSGLCSVLQSNQHHGLDPAASEDASIQEHKRVYGANTFPPVPQKNFFVLCYENVQDPIILLLIAAALVSSCSRSCSLMQHGSAIEAAACMDECMDKASLNCMENINTAAAWHLMQGFSCSSRHMRVAGRSFYSFVHSVCATAALELLCMHAHFRQHTAC